MPFRRSAERRKNMALPDAGDVNWVEFGDTRGTEQSGRRPALVLTSREFHEQSPRSIVCPITSKRHDWPTNVLLPEDLKVKGAVLVDQVRAIDRAERMFGTIDKVPAEIVQAVRTKLAALLAIDAVVPRLSDDL